MRTLRTTIILSCLNLTPLLFDLGRSKYGRLVSETTCFCQFWTTRYPSPSPVLAA